MRPDGFALAVPFWLQRGTHLTMFLHRNTSHALGPRGPWERSMFKSVEDFQKFSAGQMEAAAQSASVLTQGLQQLFAETTGLSKKTVETGTDAFQNLMASRSFDRAVEVQMNFAKSTYDSMVSGSTKIGGIVSTTAQDLFKPLEGAFTKMQDTARG